MGSKGIFLQLGWCSYKKALVWYSGINPEIISGILNFQDLDFRDSGLLKLPGLGFLEFRIPELQNFAGFLVFQDPEPLPNKVIILKVLEKFWNFELSTTKESNDEFVFNNIL